MIIKPRIIPLQLQKLKALERRLTPEHPKRFVVEKDAAKSFAGYKGEQSIDYPLTFLPSNQFYILHDLRLYDGSHYFQIDTLILSRSFFLILEVKNIYGTLIFDSDFTQFIRKNGEKEEAFLHPLIQVSRHQAQLSTWLQQKSAFSVPIETLVVIGNNYAVLKRTGQKMYENVIHGSLLPDKINHLQSHYPKSILSHSQLESLSLELTSAHKVRKQEVLKQYGIPLSQIIKGVQCPECFRFSMQRQHGIWQCPLCSYRSKTAHLQALRDYSLLFSSMISNREARVFLHVSSPHTVKRLLQSYGFTRLGISNRGAKYLLRFADKVAFFD